MAYPIHPSCLTTRDQRVYVQDLNPDGTAASDPRPLTAEGAKLRFADYLLDAGRNRLIAVCEDHSEEGAEAKNTVCAIGELIALAL